VRPVRTKRGITIVGLFSAAITQAEREADAPYREAMASNSFVTGMHSIAYCLSLLKTSRTAGTVVVSAQ
jgi:hypothetical protein